MRTMMGADRARPDLRRVRPFASTRQTWRVVFIDIGEAVTYCPECAEREFGEEEWS
jgi:hypothetical protein